MSFEEGADDAITVLRMIPGSIQDRSTWGRGGGFDCPVCARKGASGVIKWTRSWRNGHVAFRCTTDSCVGGIT